MHHKTELLTFLRKKTDETHVAVIPDFFIDRLLDLNCRPSQLSPVIEKAAEHKGGSIDNIPQTELPGGNAVNTASALAALGATVTPLICTSKLGRKLLKLHLKSQRIDLSHVKLMPKASLTTALEFKAENGKTNIMLRDVGSLADFGPENLTEHDYQLFENADYVCIFNWAGTKKHGTQLAETIFKRVKTKGKGKTYFDTADPTPNTPHIPELINRVLKNPHVDTLSLNENEAVTYADHFIKNDQTTKKKTNLSEMALQSARILAKHLPARIDLHTTNLAATLTKNKEVKVPTFKITPLRATGAGDAWNAGNILGDAYDLSDEGRLTLANAVAASYLIDPEGLHPTQQRLIKFIETSQFPA